MPDRGSVRLRHSPVAFLTAGEGPAVLLLHGIGSSADSFVAQIEALSGRFRAIAWDAPGYGESEDPPSPPGMDGYADAAGRLISGLRAEPTHVVGVSWGGVIATRLALRHPELVRSLVLADSTRGSAVDPAAAAAMRRRGADLAAEGPAAFAVKRSPRLLSPAARPELVERVTATMARSIRNPGYGWAAQALAETDHTGQLARLDVPTLVVVGEHDDVATLAGSEELANRVPGSRLEVIPGAGHLANQERPDRFNHLLLSFLDEVEAVGRPNSATTQGAQTR